jgi:hypothetical protein
LKRPNTAKYIVVKRNDAAASIESRTASGEQNIWYVLDKHQRLAYRMTLSIHLFIELTGISKTLSCVATIESTSIGLRERSLKAKNRGVRGIAFNNPLIKWSGFVCANKRGTIRKAAQPEPEISGQPEQAQKNSQARI